LKKEVRLQSARVTWEVDNNEAVDLGRGVNESIRDVNPVFHLTGTGGEGGAELSRPRAAPFLNSLRLLHGTLLTTSTYHLPPARDQPEILVPREEQKEPDEQF